MALCAALAREGYGVSAHDPAGAMAARASLPDAVAIEEDPAAALAGAQVVVVTTPWPLYRRVPETLRTLDAGGVVLLDPWRMFTREEIGDAATLVPLGKAPDPGA